MRKSNILESVVKYTTVVALLSTAASSGEILLQFPPLPLLGNVVHRSPLSQRETAHLKMAVASLYTSPLSPSISFRLLLVCSRVIPGHFIIIRRGKEGPFLSLYSPLIHSNRRGLV